MLQRVKKGMLSFLMIFLMLTLFLPNTALGSDLGLQAGGAGGAGDTLPTLADNFGQISLLAGTDRYETAVKISQAGWADKSSPYAVLSAGMDENLVDALTAAPLSENEAIFSRKIIIILYGLYSKMIQLSSNFFM